MKKNKLIDGLLIFTIFNLLLTREAKAYLDPGSGSYLLQILLAGFFSLLLAVKTFWRRISYLLSKIFKGRSNPDEKRPSDR